MLALLETKQEQSEGELGMVDPEEGQGQKSTEHYLIKNGLVRSRSDPDPLKIQ